MKCKGCGRKIRQGETYIAFTRNVECETLPKVIEVADSANLRTYHPACEPDSR